MKVHSHTKAANEIQPHVVRPAFEARKHGDKLLRLCRQFLTNAEKGMGNRRQHRHPTQSQSARLNGAPKVCVGHPPNGHSVTPDQPLTGQQQQCVQNEVDYANRTRADFMAGADNRVLKSVGGGALGGAMNGGRIGLEIGLGEGPLGWAVGGFVGATVGAGAGALAGGGKEVWSQYRYDNSFMGLPSTDASSLQANIQKNCGVSATVQ